MTAVSSSFPPHEQEEAIETTKSTGDDILPLDQIACADARNGVLLDRMTKPVSTYRTMATLVFLAIAATIALLFANQAPVVLYQAF